MLFPLKTRVLVFVVVSYFDVPFSHFQSVLFCCACLLIDSFHLITTTHRRCYFIDGDHCLHTGLCLKQKCKNFIVFVSSIGNETGRWEQVLKWKETGIIFLNNWE